MVYNNPNNLKVLSVAKGDEFVISWNLDIRDKGYAYTRMILREKGNSEVICVFDNIHFKIYEHSYQGNILSIQRTLLKLSPFEFELDEVLFSIENVYQINETTQNVEVYDYIPIFVICKFIQN